MSKKGQTRALAGILVGILVVTAFGFGFSQLIQSMGDSYNQAYDASDYTAYNQLGAVTNTTDELSNQFIGNGSTYSGGVSAFDRAFTIGVATTGIATQSPGIFATIITSIANTLGIDTTFKALAILFVSIVCVSTFLYLLLGRS